MKKFPVLFIIVCFLLSALIVVSPDDDSTAKAAGTGDIGSEKDKWDSNDKKDSFRINSDLEFIAANGVTGGSGTKSDPFTIEGWSVDGRNTGYCIYIGNTTKFFKIYDCYLRNASGDDGQYYWNSGVAIYNAINGRVYNNNISECGRGVTIHTSSKIKVNNTNLYSCRDQGVWLKDSTLCTVNQTKIENIYINPLGNPSFENGFLYTPWTQVAGTVFTDNKVHSRRTGNWYMNTSNNPSFKQSSIKIFPDTKYRLTYYTKIARTGTVMIPNDSITWRAYDGGTQIYVSKHGLGTSNWNRDGATFTTKDELTTLDLTIQHNGASATPIAYEDVSLYPMGDSGHTGVLVENSNNITVYRNSFSQWTDGLAFEDFNGVKLDNSHYSVVTDNTFLDRTRAVFPWYSDNNEITWNTMTNGEYGIFSSNSDSNLIDNNTVTDCFYRGMQFSLSNYNDIINNSLQDNEWSGLFLSLSHFNTIAHNDIRENEKDGIFLSLSDDNRLHWNDLISNTMNGIRLTSSDRADVQHNYLNKNLQNGIIAVSSHFVEVRKNNCSDNSQIGISFDS